MTRRNIIFRKIKPNARQESNGLAQTPQIGFK